MNEKEAIVVDADQADFRVKVSLERYFSDERARCYMSCSRGRPVRWLARRLRRTFSLPRPFALLSRGHLLPPAEPLSLLQPDDPIEVIPTKALVPESDEARDPVTPSPEITRPRSSSSPRSAPDETDAPPARLSPAPAHLSPSPACVSPAPACHSPSPACHSPAPARLSPAPVSLEVMKRRALEILDVYSAPTRRRRRVRRRRPRASLPAPSSPPASLPVPSSPPATILAPPSPPALLPAPPSPTASLLASPSASPSPPAPPPRLRSPAPAAVVLRNGAASPRAARLVRALADGDSEPDRGTDVARDARPE